MQEDQVAAWRQGLAKSRQLADEQQRELSKLRAESETLRHRCSKLETSLADSSRNISSQGEEISKLEDSLIKEKQASSVLQLKLNSLETEKQSLSDQCTTKTNQISEVQDQLEQCREDNCVLQEKFDRAQVRKALDLQHMKNSHAGLLRVQGSLLKKATEKVPRNVRDLYLRKIERLEVGR